LSDWLTLPMAALAAALDMSAICAALRLPVFEVSVPL
jgi:hypothetical protein